ncbi:MAG TPA: tetratricopeptide repeat protein, partial [Mariprofundaceae bacterium]|nr:tetratricopeptide repeat protein [Mariprofundaceae bacterium]
SAGQARADLLSDAIQDYQFQDFTQSESKLRQLLQQNPDNLMAHYYLGAVLQQQGKLDEAITHYEIVATAPHPIQGIEATLANAYIAAGRADKALPYLETNALQHPSDDDAALQYATALQADGQVDAASAIYRRLINGNSRLADQARFQLGQMLVSDGAYVSAVQVMKTIDPNSSYGSAAKTYIEALKPITRPLNVYVSVEGFYNDNPGGTSSSLIGTTTAVSGGSQGLTLVAAVNTRDFEASPHLRLKLGYLFSGTYYRSKTAKQLNFTGHFIYPSALYAISPDNDVELKGDIQLFALGGQKLATNLGGTLTATHHIAGGHSLNIHGSYLDKRFTKNYLASGVLASLEYLDARSTGVGAGATLMGSALIKDWNGTVAVDYTYSDEKPKNSGSADPALATKALDSHFREHAARVNISMPMGLADSRMALLVNANYSYKDFTNLQSGSVYPSAIGLHMKSIMLTTGAKLQMLAWKEGRLNFSIGMDYTASHSQASELTYKSNRYFAALSAAY